jgi:hypothetical protein
LLTGILKHLPSRLPKRHSSNSLYGRTEYSPEDVSEMRYRLSELTGKPVLTENESAELYELNRILASLPGQASPSSPAVPPAAFPGGYPGGFPPTSVKGRVLPHRNSRRR